MRITRLIYLFFLLETLLLASCKTATLTEARERYLRGEYYAASETYRKVYRNVKPDQRPLRSVVAYEMAETYRRLNSATRAANAYANAIRYNYPDTLMYLHYAQMLHKEGKYTQAQNAYEEFLELDSLNSVGLIGVQGAKNAEIWRKNPTRYVVKRMDLFNSNRGEFSPMLAQDDAVLYITSSREEARGDSISNITGMKNNDIFIVTKNDEGEWQKPTILESEINTKFDEGTPSISPTAIIFTHLRPSTTIATTTKIYFSQRGRGSWNAGQELTISARDTLSVLLIHLFRYRRLSLFCFGYARRIRWKRHLAPEWMEIWCFTEIWGAEINTSGDEMFPYIKTIPHFIFRPTDIREWAV